MDGFARFGVQRRGPTQGEPWFASVPLAAGVLVCRRAARRSGRELGERVAQRRQGSGEAAQTPGAGGFDRLLERAELGAMAARAGGKAIEPLEQHVGVVDLAQPPLE